VSGRPARPGPRLFGIAASRAPVVAVLRRGPTRWSHVGRWDVDRESYTPGAWLSGNLYPQRCDLSPDGQWFCYFTLKQTARWPVGPTYLAISRLPWLTALAAWGTCGTWTRGAHFVDSRRVWEVGAPAQGDAAPCRKKLGLALTRPHAFAVERRRGWTETPDSPPRAPSDMWDERRVDRLTMEKPQPGSKGAVRLAVRGRFAAFRSALPGWDHHVEYELAADGRAAPLADVQWADWAADGRLLVATRDGRLQIRAPARRGRAAGGFAVSWERDLAALDPDPAPPPAEAHRW
jgi:hypothetical protein